MLSDACVSVNPPPEWYSWRRHGVCGRAALRIATLRPAAHRGGDGGAPAHLGVRVARAPLSGAARPGPEQRDARPRPLRVRAPGTEADELRSGRLDDGRGPHGADRGRGPRRGTGR